MDKLTPKETSKGAEEIVLTQIKQDFITPANAIFDYIDMVEKVLNDKCAIFMQSILRCCA